MDIEKAIAATVCSCSNVLEKKGGKEFNSAFNVSAPDLVPLGNGKHFGGKEG